MQRASTSENSSFNIVQLKYFWRTRVRPEHSKRICFKEHLQWSQTGWLSLDKRYEWVTRVWPILSRVMTVLSRRFSNVHCLFFSQHWFHTEKFVCRSAVPSLLPFFHTELWDIWKEAVCRHFVSSNGRQNASLGCHICHFISFYTDVTWNPTQCDVFTGISQLSVKFQYVENCHIRQTSKCGYAVGTRWR